MNCLYGIKLLPVYSKKSFFNVNRFVSSQQFNNKANMFPTRRFTPRIKYNSMPPRIHLTGNRSRLDYVQPSFGFNFRMDYVSMRIDINGPHMHMDWDKSTDYFIVKNDNNHRSLMKVHSGQLQEHHAGLKVEISGKVPKQKLRRFLTRKDTNGLTQCIVLDDKCKVANNPIDSYMVIHGTVSKRPKNLRNSIMNTGNIEVFRKGKDASKDSSMMQIRHASSFVNSLGVTSEEFNRCASSSLSRIFLNRTNNCGELNAAQKGTAVTLCGWVESKQGRFIQLRDGYGLVQIVIPAGNDNVNAVLANITSEMLVEISGIVCLRPESQINNTMTTGDIEVQMQTIKLIVPDEDLNKSVEPTIIGVNSFTMRTYNCGQLRDEHIGQVVTLCGWLEFHRVGKFVILRDGYGRTQLIIPEENKKLQQEIDKLSYESILQVTGMVTSRPPGSEQPAMSTGRVEVVIQDMQILNRARNKLPFNLREFNKAKESLRMQYRYLDLRYSEMQRNLRTRSRMLMDMREFLVNQAGFVDVETPTLFKAAPGGAQEFVVPTRFPGQFYSLVQSPQQFKQMLMAGAIDRYFQIARCYRDEGARSDRQPEFTQLDIEMSFTTVEGVIDLIERLLKYCWPKHMLPLSIPFERICYKDAMELYGSDKPDISISNILIDCIDIFKSNTNFINGQKDKENFDARALVFRKPFTDLTNSVKRKYNSQFASAHPNAKLIQNKFQGPPNNWILSLSKLLGGSIPNQLIDHLNLNDDCILFLAYGNKNDVYSLLGKIRIDFVNHLEQRGHEVRTGSGMHFMWVVDFPLFEKDQNEGLTTVHHPFTAPHPDDLLLLNTDPLNVRSQTYDLVLNGNEIAGGSIRIHDVEQQKYILDKLKIPQNFMQHLLDALASGCPPHGGAALGLDRLLAVMLKTNSIRDVIAFPKGIEGRDPLSGAPVPISEDTQKLYHIQERREDIDTIIKSI